MVLVQGIIASRVPPEFSSPVHKYLEAGKLTALIESEAIREVNNQAMVAQAHHLIA